MRYHIKNMAGDTIASFKHECDRDICFDAFRDYYGEDFQLDAVNS